MNPTDDELVMMAKGGDAAAFGAIVDRYYRVLFNFLARMLSNREDAEDALHDTFVKAAGAVGDYRLEGKFKSWLFTIANNTAITMLRERKRRGSLPGFSASSAGEGNPNPVDFIPDVSREPAKNAETREFSLMLENAVASLPPNQRQVFTMRHVSGLSFREISEILNIPVNTALGRMHYAVKKIKEFIGESP